MYKLVILLLISLIFRLILTQWGFHHDLLSTAGWGEWIYKNGTKGFYENSIWIYSWPTQLPIINYIHGFSYYLFDQKLLWFFSYIAAVIQTHNFFPNLFEWFFDFLRWFNSLYSDTPFRWGFLISMKIIPVLTDTIIGLTVFLTARRKISENKSFLLAFLYLFSPFSWYLSANWGQYDQLSFMLLLSSFLLLYKRHFVFSSLFFFVSSEIKPTSVYFLPLYFFYFLSLKPKLISMIISVVINILAFIITTAPFADRNVFSYTKEIIYHVVFFKERFLGLVNHSFNFWQMLSPLGGRTSYKYLGIGAAIWGYLSLMVFFVWSIRIILKKNSLQNLLLSLYILSSGSYLFATGMVDRYFFPAIGFLLLLIPFFNRLLKWWLLVSFIFFINLFYSWGFPFFDPTYEAWKNELIIRFLSLTQLVLFFIIVYKTEVYKYFPGYKNNEKI